MGENEVVESGAYRKVVARIDGLCDQLVALESVVAASNGSASLAEVDGARMTIANIGEMSKQLDQLAAKVEGVESGFDEINGRFDEMDTEMENRISDVMEQLSQFQTAEHGSSVASHCGSE